MYVSVCCRELFLSVHTIVLTAAVLYRQKPSTNSNETSKQAKQTSKRTSNQTNKQPNIEASR